MPRRIVPTLVALLASLAVLASASGLETTNIQLILDVSGSMSDPVPGGVKIDVARQAIEQMLLLMPSSYNVGLRFFGHRHPVSDVGRSCLDTELVVPMRPFTPSQHAMIRDQLRTARPMGMTPIARTLEEALNDFFGMTGKNVIILVSDGEETCGGDPLAVADYVAALEIGLKVYVIGFDVSSRTQLEGIATRTGGAYYEARNAIELGRALQQALWQATSVLFFDDFEGEMSAAWRTNPVRESRLGADKGSLTILGTKYEHQPLRAFVGSTSWDDYALAVDVIYDPGYGWRSTYPTRPVPWDRNNQVVLFVHVQDMNNMVGFFLQPGRESGLRVMRDGVWSDLLAKGTVPPANSYHVRVTAHAGRYTATVNDQLIATLEDRTLSRGYVGLQCAHDVLGVHFDNFMVTPLGAPRR